LLSQTNLISVEHKDLPCKKHQKLQAAREMLEDKDLTEKPEVRVPSSLLNYITLIKKVYTN
jgi:hypothetical protein